MRSPTSAISASVLNVSVCGASLALRQTRAWPPLGWRHDEESWSKPVPQP
jgi:hypothetical protein